MALIITEEVGVYWAKIKPVTIGNDTITKVNVRIVHDDLFRYARFSCLAVTDELLQVQEQEVVLKNAPATEETPEIKDYTNWSNGAEAAYEMVCKKLGYKLVKK